MSRFSKREYILSFLVLAAALFWGLAIVGLFRSYSPIPFWDMWSGYLEFYIKVSGNDFGEWWKPHNEHRIVLSRLLFWMDLSWFNGSVWFLLLINYILVAISCFIFFIALRERAPKYYQVFSLVVIIWLSSWSQHENLIWGFQSQFILAQLLPLTAFYLMHRASSNKCLYDGYFIWACFFGILSLGSMANGVIALPLMTIYAFIVRFGWKRIFVVASLACFGVIAYFYEYTSPTHHGSLGSALRENPYGLILYVMTYIGGPFYYIAGNRMGGVVVAQFAGGILILLSTYISLITLRSSNKSTLVLALLFFILYIGGSALGTAGGRLIFGVEQALSSRYMTPSLMAWAALFVIIAPKLAVLGEKYKSGLFLPLSLLIFAMLPMQIKAWNSGGQILFERSVAGLAVAMGVNDKLKINQVYPSSEQALSIGKIASERGLSYFSRTEFNNVNNNIGKSIDGFSRIFNACQGHIDYIEPIEGDNNYMRISGWIFDKSRKKPPSTIWLINQQGFAVGYALVGHARPDVAKAIDEKANISGFKGYFLSEAKGSAVTVFDPVNNCGFSDTLPVSFFTLLSDINRNPITVDTNKVLPNSQWIGSDYYKSKISGVVIIGSFIQSDADKGSVSLQINRGDRILFRSGPTPGKQVLNILDETLVLPTSLNWSVLDFSSNALPDSFIVTFRDGGEGWGEWSAIGVLSQRVKE